MCVSRDHGRPESVGASVPAFAVMFRTVLSADVGRPADSLTADDQRLKLFIKDLTEHMRKNGSDLNSVPLAKSLVNWCRGDSVPYWNRFEPVYDFLFNGKPNDPHRARLREAWGVADAARSAGLGKPRRSTAANLDGPEPGVSDFDAKGEEPLQQGLAELRIDPPARGGNKPSLVDIRIAIAFAECEDMVEGQGITLALTDAALVPSYAAGCAPELNSRAGEGENGCEGLVLRAGQWLVTGPRNEAGHLDGEPLDASQPLLTLRVPGQETDGLSLTLRSKPKALVVIPDDPEDESRITKDKLLQLLLQRVQASDKDGWITWGRAGLHRKKPA